MEEFDCHGKLSSLTLESVSVDPKEPDREEQRLLVAKLFFDSSGILIRRQEPGKTVFFHYDDDGFLEKEVEVREREQISREKSYRYAAGRLLEESSGGEKTSYHYNSQDRLSYTTSWMGDIQESICSYGFDGEGRITLREIRDNEGELLRRCRLKRDPMGLIVEEITINQSNMVLEHCRFSYPVFHRENWLKRERWSLTEGEEPVLTEILYRNIALASDSQRERPEEPELPPQESPAGGPASEAPLPHGVGAPGSASKPDPEAGRNPYQDPEPDRISDSEKQNPLTSDPAEGSKVTASSRSGERAVEKGQETSDSPSRLPRKELRFKNGQYRGQVDEEDRPHGLGEFWGRDGSRYSGEFRHGRMEGHGNLLHRNGSSYTGSFAKGFPQGEGECLWPDGNRYRGEFVRGEMHGIGSFTWTDGSRFTGLFEHNKSTDQGLLESAEPPGTIEINEPDRKEG